MSHKVFCKVSFYVADFTYQRRFWSIIFKCGAGQTKTYINVGNLKAGIESPIFEVLRLFASALLPMKDRCTPRAFALSRSCARSIATESGGDRILNSIRLDCGFSAR